MKHLIVIILFTLLIGCSKNTQNQQVSESSSPTIVSVSQACSMLGLNMTKWQSSDNDGIYRCISDYIDISPNDNTNLPNNLAYYVEGTENTVNELKIVLNVNDKKYNNKAKKEFIDTSKKVYKNIKSDEFPKQLIKAISSKSNYSLSNDNLIFSIENDIWDNQRGFSQKFIIRLK